MGEPATPDALHYSAELPLHPALRRCGPRPGAAWCDSAGDGRDATALGLPPSEAVTNAVRHAATARAT